jgi:hypothetical protein
LTDPVWPASAIWPGRSTGGNRRTTPLPIFSPPDAATTLTGVTGTNVFRSIFSAVAGGAATGGLASTGFGISMAFGAGAGAGAAVEGTSIGLAGFCGGGMGGCVAGRSGSVGCDAIADCADPPALAAGPTISQTIGYRTVLNPIENATNTIPSIVAADLGITLFPSLPFQLSLT